MLDLNNSGMSFVTKTKVDADRGTVMPTKNCLRDVDAILDSQTLGSSLRQHAFSIIRRFQGPCLPAPHSQRTILNTYSMTNTHTELQVGTAGQNIAAVLGSNKSLYLLLTPLPKGFRNPRTTLLLRFYRKTQILPQGIIKPSPRDYVLSVPPLIHLRTLAGIFKRTW